MIKQLRYDSVFADITDIVEKIIQDDYMKVSDIGKFLSRLFDLKGFTGKIVNYVLLYLGAIQYNNNSKFKAKYVPTEFGAPYCQEINNTKYYNYYWKPSFVLKLLKIDFYQEPDYMKVKFIKERLKEIIFLPLFDSDLVLNNINEIRNLIK